MPINNSSKLLIDRFQPSNFSNTSLFWVELTNSNQELIGEWIPSLIPGTNAKRFLSFQKEWTFSTQRTSQPESYFEMPLDVRYDYFLRDFTYCLGGNLTQGNSYDLGLQSIGISLTNLWISTPQTPERKRERVQVNTLVNSQNFNGLIFYLLSNNNFNYNFSATVNYHLVRR